jgi:peptide/nickel transport system permease protein
VLFVILLGSSFLIYNLTAIASDPLEELRISSDPNAKQQILVLIRSLHLDVPPPLRYFSWLQGVLNAFTGHFSLGFTRSHESVVAVIGHAIPVSIRLVLGATILAIVLGITIGIVTALRQYSRFDYSMTFLSFLFFSLPIFWVAVLLKEYLAIGFNDFLYEPVVSPPWLIGLSVFAGLFWASILGGNRAQVWLKFGVAFAANAVVLFTLSETHWFTQPSLGPIVVFAMSVGVAFATTHISVGISSRRVLFGSLAVSVVGLAAYFPLQSLFTKHFSNKTLLILFLGALLVGAAIGFFATKVDRGPAIRTTSIVAFLTFGIIYVDRLMRTWQGYSETDAVNYRPVPTVGESNSLLEPGNYWFTTLDNALHLFLPTIALTIISFAGYVRFSRGSVLEVLNQDYIRTARAKGLTERTVIMRHAFRNALIPLTTIIAADIAGVIGGAIITERVFGWVGMGTLFNKAIGGQDLNLLMGVFFVTSSLALLANLVADLLYSALDPRIRIGK